MNRKRRTRPVRQRNPTIEAFRALAMLDETGSVTETARRLDVSQPVVSKKLQIFKDEESWNAILVKREGRPELTDAADAALPAIRELVARYDRLIAYLRTEHVSPQVVRISTGSFGAEHYLPVAIARLRAEFENCQFETHVCRGHDRIVGAARGVFDVAIVTHNQSQIRRILQDARLDASRLKVECLGRHPMSVLAAVESAAGQEMAATAEDQRISLGFLSRWELIGPDRQSGLRRQLERRLRGQPLYFAVEGGGWTAAKEYARRGLGVAIVPAATVCDADRSSLVARRMPPEFDVTDYLLSRREDFGRFGRLACQAIKAAVCSQRESQDSGTAV